MPQPIFRTKETPIITPPQIKIYRDRWDLIWGDKKEANASSEQEPIVSQADN